MTNDFDQIISSAGDEMHRNFEHDRRHAVRQPAVVHFDQAVAAGEDQIDETLAAARLAQPVA